MYKVIICGLGAIGLTIAQKINQNCDLKILVDSVRLQRFQEKKPSFNGIEQDFEYILPDSNFDADLILIATKSPDLDSAIKNIKNFVHKNTIIISLLNGISSEKEIEKFYPNASILKSYFVGHSAMRDGNTVLQDGIGKIVIENHPKLVEIMKNIQINFEIAEDIDYSMWLKFTLNLFSNQTSAILNLHFGQLKNNKKFIEFSKKIINEVKIIAKAKGINNLQNLEKDALNFLEQMSDNGKTSMLQDFLSKRKTEVDIFAGEIIKLGKELDIPTPYNQVLYDLIKIKEETL